jgi:hypothetical protein
MQSQEISGSELGAIKYISELLDWNVKKTANLFILILIFVFDPLAITLVIATNQAFKGERKDENTNDVIHKVDDFEEDINVSHKEETDQVPTKYRPSTDQVDGEEYFDNEDYWFVETTTTTTKENLIPTESLPLESSIKRLTYTKNV